MTLVPVGVPQLTPSDPSSGAAAAAVHSEVRGRDGVMLVSGLVGVVGNVLAVAFLNDVPGAYRLAQLDRWATGVVAHPIASSASAFAFTVGLLGLAVWALSLAEHAGGRVARAGGWVIAMGALGNALGTVTPLVLAFSVRDAGPSSLPVARALLGLTLTLDAVFNVTLGAGLLLFAAGASAAHPRWLRGWAALAGVASLPVAAQAVYDPAANVLLVAAPIWLGFMIATSLRRWRSA